MRQIILFVVGLAAIVIQTVAAAPILFSMKDTTVQRGTTFLYAVQVDSDLTGSGVYSYEMAITYDAASFRLDTIITTGTLTASWGIPGFARHAGSISIAHAGLTPLAGTGALFYFRVTAIPTYWSGGGYFQCTGVTLNEGLPSTIVRNGYVGITNPPSITVSPENTTIAVGNTTQFSVSGGTAPFLWSTTDPAVATIDQTGLLTGLHHGTCKVIAADQSGIIDTSGIVRVLAFTISVHDSSFLQGQTVLVPVYVSDLSAADVTAGQFTVMYDPNMVTALGTERAGTLLATTGEVQSRVSPGSISVIFAGNSAVSGSGVLLYIRFRASLLYTGGTWIQIRNLVFNENIEGVVDDGLVYVTNRSILAISPASGILVAGDSIQLSVSGSPTYPIQWSVSDPLAATISASGVLKAVQSGVIQVSVTDSVGATGTSGSFSLYDIRLQGGSGAGSAGDTVVLPLRADAFIAGIYSFQFTLTYDPNVFEPAGVESPGAGWSVESNTTAPGTITMAAMSASPRTDSGTIAGLRFIIKLGAPLGTFAITFQSTLLNEGKPLPLTINGSIQIGPTDVGDSDGEISKGFVLHQNYPNPFNPATSIVYELPCAERVDVSVFDASGRRVAFLFSGTQPAGRHSIQFDARGLASGVYYYSVRTGHAVRAKPMLLAR